MPVLTAAAVAALMTQWKRKSSAAPSEPVSFKKMRVERRCYGCQRKVTLAEPLWFVGGEVPGVFGRECFHLAAAWPLTPSRPPASAIPCS